MIEMKTLHKMTVERCLEALKSGVAKLKCDSDTDYEIMCCIGGYNFYFDANVDPETAFEEYITNKSLYDIAKFIATAINNLAEDFDEDDDFNAEAAYYTAIFEENNI